MKRLLVYMMVVGMASAANASMVTISGGDMPYDDTLTLTVAFSGTEDIVSFDVLVTSGDSSLVALENVVILAANRNTQYDYIGAITDGYEVSGSSDAAALGTTWFTVDAKGLGSPGDVGESVTIYLENVLIYDTDWSYVYPTMGSLTIEIIPEPMTLALLGLGGLLVRRRR